MPWFWNEETARYHWRNGSQRFLSRRAVLGYVDESIAASEEAVSVLSTLVSENMLIPGDWRDVMRREIKDEYIRQYLLGRGGRAQMASADWGSIGGMLKEQYSWLDLFAEEVALGDLSEGQIRVRSRMYINSAREAFERANERSQVDAGMTEVIWVIDAGAENCPDCIDLAGLGWSLIEERPFGGAYPGSGDTVCLTSCKCHLQYR